MDSVKILAEKIYEKWEFEIGWPFEDKFKSSLESLLREAMEIAKEKGYYRGRNESHEDCHTCADTLEHCEAVKDAYTRAAEVARKDACSQWICRCDERIAAAIEALKDSQKGTP